MIGRITGKLLEVSPPTICIQAGALGYELDVPMSTLYNLPAVGSDISLYTHLSIRDDAHVLYGFATKSERNAFRILIKVTGIGARTALAILSGIGVEDLAQAIDSEDTALLVKVPGIGKKTAERLLLELRDKFTPALGGTSINSGGNTGTNSDVLNALQALGYSANEARKAIAKLPAGLSVSDSIRQALKNLSKA